MIILRICVLKILASPSKKLEQVGKVSFELFSKNFLKTNADKHHLILSTDERFSISIDNKVIKNSAIKTISSLFEYYTRF